MGHYDPVPIGHNIYISHRDFCPRWPSSRIIHIWRNDMPENSCEYVHTRISGVWLPTKGVIVDYKDGESLANASISIEEIATFCAGGEELLIHCTVGQTRSPTLAIIAKVVRGATPFDAARDVLQANWQYRKIVSNLCLTPLKEIFEWAEHR